MLNLDSDQRRAHWHMPDELRAGLLPREVRYTWRAWGVFVALGCCMTAFLATSVPWLVFAPVVLVFGALGWSVVRTRRLIAFGTPIAAVVTTVPSKRGKPMRYQYEPSPGDLISASAAVPPGTVHEGDIVTVLYDPGRPRSSTAYPSGLVVLKDR